MYFLFKHNKRIFVFIMLFVICSVRLSFANETDVFLVVEDKKSEELYSFLYNFSDKKFDIYLKDVSHYSAADYHSGICNLFTEYKLCYSNLNECTEKMVKIKKHYTNSWVKELISRFGIEYISNNIESVKNILLNIHLKRYSTFCIDAEKDGLYAEIQYIITVREYFKYYLEFYKSLGIKEKKLYLKKKKKAEEVLRIVSEYPLQVILYGRRLGASLELTNHVSLKKDVAEFIINNRDLSEPFDLIEAVNDVLNGCGRFNK